MKKKKKKKSVLKPKLMQLPIIKSGKIQEYTADEASLARLDRLGKVWKPFADKVAEEQEMMIFQAMYHIMGERRDITREMVVKMFGWLCNIKLHPQTGKPDMLNNFRVFVFYGDGAQEVFKGTCSKCLGIFTELEFFSDLSYDKNMRAIMKEQKKVYKLSPELKNHRKNCEDANYNSEAQKEPVQLLWDRTYKWDDPNKEPGSPGDPYFTFNEQKEVIGCKNNWTMLFDEKDNNDKQRQN